MAISRKVRYQCSPSRPRALTTQQRAPDCLSIMPRPTSSPTSIRSQENPAVCCRASRRTRLKAPTPMKASDFGSATAQSRMATMNVRPNRARTASTGSELGQRSGTAAIMVDRVVHGIGHRAAERARGNMDVGIGKQQPRTAGLPRAQGQGMDFAQPAHGKSVRRGSQGSADRPRPCGRQWPRCRRWNDRR